MNLFRFVLIGVCVLGALPQNGLCQGPPGGKPGGFGGFQRKPPTEEEKAKARERMGITREQQAAIEAIFTETDTQMRDIFNKLRDLQNQQRELYRQYDFDRNAANSLRKEIVMTYRRIGVLHAENEEKFRKILNKDQFDKMQAMLKEQAEQRRKEFESRRPKPPTTRQN